MADNKQYVTQIQEKGSVMISEDVIATIVAHATNDVEGVVSINVKPGSDIVELIGKKNWGKGIRVVIKEDDTLEIDCNITISYGHSVVNVAKAVQDAICGALDDMTGISIAAINVNVCGIVRQ